MNEKLRRARDDRNWSIDEAAARVQVSRTTYIRWEQAKQTPHGSSLNLACDAFKMSPEQLGFKDFRGTPEVGLVQVPPVQSLSTEKASPINMFGTGIIALLLAQQQQGWTPEELQYQTEQEMRRLQAMNQHYGEGVSRRQALVFLTSLPIAMLGLTHTNTVISASLAAEEILPLYVTSMPACWKLYFDGHPDEVELVLSSYMNHLTPLAQHHSKQQPIAAGLTSQVYQLAALIAKHHEDFGTALTYCKQASLYGRIADEPNLIASSLIRQVDVLFYRKRFTQALEILQEAEQYAPRVSPLLRGRIYSELAPAYAQLGNDQAALQYMGLAHDTTPDRPEDDPGYLFTRSNHYIVHLNDTLSFLYARKPKDALEAITKAAASVPDTLMTHRIEVLNYKTICTIELNNMETSIAHFKDLIESGKTLHSDLFQSEAQEIYEKMGMKWPREQRIKELEDFFH